MLVTRQRPAQSGFASGQPVAVCGFLTLCQQGSTGDFEGAVITAGDSETKEGLRVEETTGEGPGGALPWLLRNVIGKERAKVGGCCELTGE